MARRAFGVLFAIGALGASPAPSGGDLFADRTAESGLDFVHFNGMTGELYLLEVNGSGAALVDYDGDGDLDAYLLQGHLIGPGKTVADAVFPPPGGPLGNRLFRNDLQPRATGGAAPRFVDVTERSGIAATGYGMGIATGDYDNDGWIDLYVTNFGSNQMLHNEGDGTFADVTAVAGTDDVRWSVPATFFDYDRDGLLDLFVGNYVDFTFARHRKCPSPTGTPDYCAPIAYDPVPDRLFHNLGGGHFEDVTRRAGLQDEYGNALGAVAADFDGNGLVDLYVANDMMPNQMWMNGGDGTFRNEGMLGGSAVNEEGQPEASMGVLAGDVDGDGDEDLFMTHLAGETNTLYLNDGRGVFRDETRRWALDRASWTYTAFGTAWIDFENDGWLDLFVANGAVYVIESLARQNDPYPLHQPNQVFRNLAGRGFRDVTAESGSVFALSEVSRGVADGDVDNDGAADLLVSNNSGPARLLMNEAAGRGHWLGLRLIAADGPRDALGARVAVHRPGLPTLWRRVRTDGSYASASDPRVLVGLGDSDVVGTVEVFWPSGRVGRWSGLRADAYTVLREAPREPRR